MNSAKPRLVVYTVLIGQKEPLRNPLETLPAGSTSDLEIDFVCLTDRPQQASPVWRMLPLTDRHLPAEKLSRRPKAMPHEYFPDVDHSLYVDNTVSFKRLPRSTDLHTEHEFLFRAFRHGTRSTPLQEAAVLATLGYEDVPTICRQLDFYAAQRAPESITPLTTGTVLLRSHHHPQVRKFGQLWWESILAFSKRDQLSLDYARQEAGLEIDYFDGITRDNDLVHWNGSYAAHRVKANFDAKRYAWQHRDDADAARDPKGHFLAHGGGDDSGYVAETSMLDFLCWKHGSSLGSQVAPRRAMADTLEALLKPHAVPGRTHLLVRVRHATGPQAFSDAELEAATQALGVLVSPAGTLNVVDLDAAQLREGGNVLVCPPPGFDVLTVIGAEGKQLGALIHQLGRLAHPARGHLIAVLGSPAPLAATAAAEAAFATALQLQARGEFHASRHDDLRGLRGNTVYALAWEAAQPVDVPVVAASAAMQR
jgi:hypothetical protein